MADRWDQLLRFGALRLSADIGDDVSTVFPRGQSDARHRTAALIDSLSASGTLTGCLRIPNTAGDLIVDADIRARQITASVDINAPQDRGARGRVSWLVNQLGDAPGDLVLEAYPKNARTGTAATLAETREDRHALLDSDHRESFGFRVIMRKEMGMGRKTGVRSPGFITSVRDLIETFYGAVVQQVTTWQPPAPKLKQTKPTEEVDERSAYDPFRWAQERPETEERSDPF